MQGLELINTHSAPYIYISRPLCPNGSARPGYHDAEGSVLKTDVFLESDFSGYIRLYSSSHIWNLLKLA